MQVWIEENEWYPYYYVFRKNQSHGFYHEADIPEEFIDEYEKILTKFSDMQIKLGEWFDGKGDADETP